MRRSGVPDGSVACGGVARSPPRLASNRRRCNRSGLQAQPGFDATIKSLQAQRRAPQEEPGRSGLGVVSLNLTDLQVLTLIKSYPGSSLYGILQKAKEEMDKWPWTIGKVQAAVARLERDQKITKTVTLREGRACAELYPNK